VYQWCEFKPRRGKNKNLTAFLAVDNESKHITSVITKIIFFFIFYLKKVVQIIIYQKIKQWSEIKPRRGKNKNMTGEKPNSLIL
jgi:hypothetical protein